MLKAILLDLGGTLWDDYASELALWADMRGELARRGVEFSDEEFEELINRCIDAYAPSLTRAILWRALDGDRDAYEQVLRKIIGRFKARVVEDFRSMGTLYPGVRELLEELKGSYKLAVASNNFTEAHKWLKGFGLDGYFDFVGLSEEVWLFKPDTRFYDLILERIGVEAKDAMMVGDRLDNDIFPCNRMRMVTVRVLSPPWDRQQPRYHSDLPDYTIEKIAELRDVLERMEKN